MSGKRERQDDLDRGFDRLDKSEGYRERELTYGLTRQALALGRPYLGQLADMIDADRANPRDRAVWGALKDFTDDIPSQLIVAGTGACEGDRIGVDRSGTKNFRDQALWIGRHFGQHDRELTLKVGSWGIGLLCRLPIFELGPGDVLQPTAEAVEFVGDFLAKIIATDPLLSPSLDQPPPWTALRKGGLPADHWAKVSLIRTHNRSIEDAISKAIASGQMQPVLDAVNYLQSTPFCINAKVLDFMLRVGGPTAPALKPKRHKWRKVGGQWKQTVRDEWKQWHKRRAWHFDVALSEFLADQDCFYCPINLEYRGRLQSICHFNFQRQDYIRGLFLFRDGSPVDERSTLWLMAHTAACADKNTWSKNKKPSDLCWPDRAHWTNENLTIIRAIGEAVLAGADPATLAYALPTKTPCQFVAACAELVQALDIPDFESRLPIPLDATNSALQHTSAMTLSAEGAFANLTPTRDGDDFYRRVAGVTWKRERRLRRLMGGEFDRDLAKAGVVPVFYGAVPGGSMVKQIRDVLRERLPPRTADPRSKAGRTKKSKRLTKDAKALASAFYKSIKTLAPDAIYLRSFLRRIAKQYAKHGKHFRWQTLMPVINAYPQPIIKPVSVYPNGKRRRVDLIVGHTDEIAINDAARAAPANFVHSYDAYFLHLVALACAKEGIPLVSVHDCFATVAAHCGRLFNILQEQFVALYENNDIPAAILEKAKHDLPKSAKLPRPPKRGNLDLRGVLLSHNFTK